MAPLSSGEAAELPDSTYSGNILTRSFFRRRGNRLAPPPGPSEPHPCPSRGGSSVWKKRDGEDRGSHHPAAAGVRRARTPLPQPGPCGARAPPPDRQQPMNGSCRRPLRTAHTLPAADVAGLALQRSFHGDRGWAWAA